MKKSFIVLFAAALLILTACHSMTPTAPYDPDPTVSPTVTVPQSSPVVSAWLEIWPYITFEIPDNWPMPPDMSIEGDLLRFRADESALTILRDCYTVHGGHDLDGHSASKFRDLFHRTMFGSIIGHIDFVLLWEVTRSNDDYFNEMAALAFVRDFGITRAQAEQAIEDWIELINSRPNPSLNTSSMTEVLTAQVLDWIFEGNNEALQEYFLWENSGFSHEIGVLMNPGFECANASCWCSDPNHGLYNTEYAQTLREQQNHHSNQSDEQ